MVDINREGNYLDAEIDSIDQYFGKSLDLTDLHNLKEHNTSLSKRVNSMIKEKENAEKEKQKQASEASAASESTSADSDND